MIKNTMFIVVVKDGTVLVKHGTNSLENCNSKIVFRDEFNCKHTVDHDKAIVLINSNFMKNILSENFDKELQKKHKSMFKKLKEFQATLK